MKALFGMLFGMAVLVSVYCCQSKSVWVLHTAVGNYEFATEDMCETRASTLHTVWVDAECVYMVKPK